MVLHTINRHMTRSRFHRQIRLLLFSSVFVDRGAERIMLWTDKYLPEDEYDIKIACLRDLMPLAERLPQMGGPDVTGLGMKHQFDMVALLRFYRLLVYFKPDILHIHSFRAAVWGRPIARLARVPIVIYSVHNKWGNKIHYFFDRVSSRFGDAIIPFSLSVKKFLIDESGHKPDRVMNPIYIGIDIDKFRVRNIGKISAVRKELGIGDSNAVIGFVGALSDQKGLFYLIDAIHRLGPEFPKLKCLLIGEGDLERELKSKVRDLGLQKQILFLGQRYDIPVLLNLMDVFVLPSLWEGLPQVVLEAMAACVPVVATAVDGTPEIITDGFNGLLVPSRDSSKFADALKRLLSDAALRSKLSERGHETVCNRFSVGRMVSDFDSLYKHYLVGANSEK